MSVISVRLPNEVITRLKTLAHLKSLQAGAEVRYSVMVREAIERYILASDRSEQAAVLR